MASEHTTESEQHNFLVLLADALRLLEHGRQLSFGQATFARAVVIFGVAAIEAAINSAIFCACKDNGEYLKTAGQHSVLDKAKNFLGDHQPACCFSKGSRESQKFDKVVQLRNSMVHPKAARFQVNVEYAPPTESQRMGIFTHQSSNLDQISVTQRLALESRALKLVDAEQVLKDCVSFFNYFNRCWGIDSETAQAIYVDWFYGAKSSIGAAYEVELLELIRKHNHWLKLEML